MFSPRASGIYPSNNEIFYAIKSRLVDENFSKYGVAMTQINCKNMCKGFDLND